MGKVLRIYFLSNWKLDAIVVLLVILIMIATNDNWWFFMLPIPIVSFLILHHFYKKSLRQIREKEFA